MANTHACSHTLVYKRNPRSCARLHDKHDHTAQKYSNPYQKKYQSKIKSNSKQKHPGMIAHNLIVFVMVIVTASAQKRTNSSGLRSLEFKPWCPTKCGQGTSVTCPVGCPGGQSMNGGGGSLPAWCPPVCGGSSSVTCPTGCSKAEATCPYTTRCHNGQCNPSLKQMGHFCAQTGPSTCAYKPCPKGMTAEMCHPEFYSLPTRFSGTGCPIARNQGGVGTKMLPVIMKNPSIPRNLDIQCATMCAVNRVTPWNANVVAKPQCAQDTPEFSTCCCRGAKVAFAKDPRTGVYLRSKCGEFIPIQKC